MYCDDCGTNVGVWSAMHCIVDVAITLEPPRSMVRILDNGEGKLLAAD